MVAQGTTIGTTIPASDGRKLFDCSCVQTGFHPPPLTDVTLTFLYIHVQYKYTYIYIYSIPEILSVMSRLVQNLYSTSIEMKTVIVNVRKTGKQRRSCEGGRGDRRAGGGEGEKGETIRG